MPDTTVACIVPGVLFLIGAIFGVLTMYARTVLLDRTKTQLFAVIAIMGTVGFVTWALIYL